jgi:hypothetical protein
MNKFNERAWAGQLIAWIQEAIEKGTTIFQHASNDEGIKVASGRTKFPDVLLFTDKVSGIVFNGWELKFPDTAADDREMLENALEKAERLKSNSFVTWNGSEAIIWQITEGRYTVENLKRLKIYPKEKGIDTRNDLADPNNYRKHEPRLKQRLFEILHDLHQLFQGGELKEAINISDETISAIREAAKFLIPLFKEQINELKGDSTDFRRAFNLWKINESSTLKILASSSRRIEVVEPEEVLAKFTYYKFIGKIIFYLTLAENLSGKVAKLELTEPKDSKKQLNSFFSQAQKIDYQAVFEADFTDDIEFNASIDKLVFRLIEVFNKFDFKILPSSLIGNILENLVPNEEKQKFGQYFTPEPLAFLVAFSAIKNRNFVVIDPTSGTGTFLNSFYQILTFLGKKNHQELLSQIWGNDISHFPAVLSVINLYKQKVDDTANFPRVTRKDYFTLQPKQTIQIPDNKDVAKLNSVEMPQFDAIISNFPFIQQEDIPNDVLTAHFRSEFLITQSAFLEDVEFKINERSDYYIYCFYNSLKFLKPDGFLAAITSNAWLGKNYGRQFKKFLLDNFSIKYVVKSNAEHWFKNSQVSTIFITLERGKSDKPTRFVTLNFKLNDKLGEKTVENLQFIEDLYTQIDNCDNPDQDWQQDEQYKTVFSNSDDTVKVSLVSRQKLIQSLGNKENWATYFISENPLSIFENNLISPHSSIFTNGRGTRTGQDKMHILTTKDIEKLKIEKDFLQPVLQSSRHVSGILHNKVPDTYLFICDKPETELQKKYPNTYKWIKKWETENNKIGVLLPKVFENRKPFWYTLKAEQPANIFISINPDKKLFFSYSPNPIHLNQRLVAIRAKTENAPIITALLNSVVSLLIVELNGVSRNLGALDLNADFFKSKMRMLNPALLSRKDKNDILTKFVPLSIRVIEQYDTEFKKKDRVEFDTAILKAYGYKPSILPRLYELLIDTIENRVEMKNR